MKQALFAVLAMVGQSAVLAQELDVKTRLESTLGLNVLSVADAPVDGLIQVTTDRGLFYASRSGQYLLQARIFNLDAGMRNETEVALSQMRRDGIKAFSDSAIEFKAKDEKYVITVFTDISCGYCQRLHNEIGQFNANGITVKYLAFPRAGVDSPTYDEMVSVWCAKNPQKAMTDAKSGDQIANASCANKVAEQYMFGQQVGVTGTPNIILPDGSMIPGYQPAAAVLNALEQAG
ncbi:thiol:disulfide interchange protein [Alteromonas aestuariivivens]|uniref:Thiol:disulfide interchange protein n=1 Tax=Alteromonas aestuariivivens TaxID=1938339 RepID=A0A3D8MCE5_9ALTE|nr:thioredoxin fold domain-containing protein [Alteromonas aestuariivivens]RDV28082.1 thiol:disulfide interchange protein [Alteromonas aestuariivivens]